jgi:3-hydroxymyristoyl/3-hydroxydecanoyl-(acyl carrier protein) dehydratase
MLISTSDITNFIPQRSPFVMIDSLEFADKEVFKGNFKVRENHLFLKGNLLGEEALVESLAQTCAAGFCYLAKQSGLKENGLGFIGAVSKLVVFGSAFVNDELVMDIKLLNSFDKIQLIEGIVSVDSTVVLTCQMKIVTP